MSAITITVFRDVNGDGIYNANVEPGVEGVEVTVTDGSGSSIVGVTTSTGVVVVDPDRAGLTGGVYRVEVVRTSLPSFLKPAATVVQFVDTTSGLAKVFIGLMNPSEYSEPNPQLRPY